MMKSIERWVSKITLVLGTVVLMLMVAQIVIDVVMRAVAGSGFPATSELVSKYYMVAVSFMPIAYAEVHRRHVEATVFTDLLSARKKQAVTLLGFIISVCVYGILTWGSLGEALEQTEKRAYVESGVDIFYTWPSYWILPVFLGLMWFVCVIRVVTLASHVFRGKLQDLDEGRGAIDVSSNQAKQEGA
ncbi:TRAP transporter small permease [Marinobacterium mangrovicola]|uniref:TRAP transporter small permease protein n=1 Tax=Marinobacterium mangrovicola TaxID=1476959 RepID=A0A4R1GJ26_9GAMM|nr:TRAP transporter small permease [Marinobacterium mangrovicola]TCK04322.1 TRAP-type C4-dicarboxylate transport system permease small subunit [Marinobacterium mangrovicola]